MTAIVRLRRSDFDQLDSPEHQDWKRHRQLLLRIPSREVWRGCLGLALLTTRPAGGALRLDHSLVADRQVRWVSLVDIPHGQFRRKSPREVHWGSLHRTLVDHGMPTLTGRPEVSCDFRAIPFERIRRGGRVIEAGPDVLNPSQRPGLFRALNALNWAMTSTAFSYRAAWRAQRDACFEALGADSCSESPILLYGEERYDHTVQPATWMPRAYLGFKDVHRSLLFDRATDSRGPSGEPNYPSALRVRLCTDVGQSLPVQAPCSGTFVGAAPSAFHGLPTLDLIFERRRERVVIRVTRTARPQVRPSQVVHEGDLVAYDGSPEVPAGWDGLTLSQRWEQVLSGSVRREHFHAWVRLWFERQLLAFQPGFVHAPSELAASTAQDHAVAEVLCWDLSPALDYYHETAGAFIFPALPLWAWWEFRGILPGEVRFDFTPMDDRFIPHVRPTNEPIEASNSWAVRARERRTSTHADGLT